METCAKRDLIRHTDHNRLKRLVKKEKNRHILKRLLFINQLYLGDSVPEACERLCISHATGYEWLKAWNENGYEGLDRVLVVEDHQS